VVKETVLRSVNESCVGSNPTARNTSPKESSYSLHPREPNQVGTDSETGTSASRGAYARGVDIQDGEGGRRDEGDHANLGNLEGLARENERGNGNCETLQEILHKTSHEVGHINTSRGGRLGLGRIRHLFGS